MILFSIDPSSSCVGIATAISQPEMNKFEIRGSGRLHPPKSRAAATERTDAMAEAVLHQLHLATLGFPAEQILVVIEITSGKVNVNRNKGGGAGLAVYGDAVGAIRMAVKMAGYKAAYVKENDWTRGHSKNKRKVVAAKYQPHYDPAKDTGGDESDAICLAYWMHRQLVKGLTPAA